MINEDVLIYLEFLIFNIYVLSWFIINVKK